MLQDQSRNRTPMPGAQAPGAAPPNTGPARAEAGIATMLAAESLAAAPTDLPAPGSPEALEAFGAACRAVDRAGFLDDAERATRIIVPGGIRLWTSDTVQAAQAGNFSCFTSEEAAAARVTPKVRLDDLLVLTLRRELCMAEAVQASRMRELFALAYPDDQEEVTDDAPAAADLDPILAGIAETRAALDQALALEAASTGNLPTAWGDACEAAVDALYEHVLAVAPTTLDGCRAAARLMLDLRTGLGLELEDEVTLLLKRIAGEPPAAAEAPVATPATPVLDAIRTHEEAWARCTQASALYDSMGDLPSQRPASAGEIEAADAAATEAMRRSDQAWRDLFRSRPQDLHELWLLLRHVEQHHAAHHGMVDAPDIWGTLTGAVAAMRSASPAPSARPHDLSKLSVAQLSGLYEICMQQREVLLAIEAQPRCSTTDRRGFGTHTILGEIVEAEGVRFAFLGDDTVSEMERRLPEDERERNLILEARVRHHLTCNGTIEPELVAEVASTWGAR